MSSRPLRFLLVSEDRATLRHLTSFLTVLGYEVDQAASIATATSAIAGQRPDVLLVDAAANSREALDWCLSLTNLLADELLYTFLLTTETDGFSAADLVEAGVDDLLAMPVVYGELLSRIRTAARVMEFDRRCGQQNQRDRLTGWLTRHSFLRQAERRLAESDGQPRAACVVMDVDHFRRVQRLWGESAADDVLRQLTERVEALLEPTCLSARLEEGRFAFLLDDSREAEAAEWAERVRQAVESESFHEDNPVSLTASFGVASQDQSAEESLARAEQALKLARYSGRNCVARDGQFDREAKAWADLAAPGKLFERTVARDIATPCHVQLSPEQTVGHAAALLDRTGLPALPVIDTEGTAIGMVTAAELTASTLTTDQLSESLSQRMSKEIASQDEEAPLAGLMEFFSHQPETTILVVHEGRPTGIVTRASLLALCEPLRNDRFAASEDFSFGSQYLRVPDLPKEEACP